VTLAMPYGLFRSNDSLLRKHVAAMDWIRRKPLSFRSIFSIFVLHLNNEFFEILRQAVQMGHASLHHTIFDQKAECLFDVVISCACGFTTQLSSQIETAMKQIRYG